MKNYLFGAFIAGAALFLASCDKEVESTDLKVDVLKTMTVKGYVFADMDLTQAGLEKAPEGTIVRLSVNYNQLQGAAGVGKWIDTVAIGADGSFTKEIPVDDDGVVLQVEPLTFEGEQVNTYGSSITNLKGVYKVAAFPVALSTTSNDIIQIVYGFTPFNGQVEWVKVKFICSAVFNEETNAVEDVSETSINVYVIDNVNSENNWATVAKTNVDGEFTIEVPKNTTVNFEFTATKRVWDGVSDYKNQKYLYQAAAGPFANKQEAGVAFGGGTKAID